MTTPGAMMGLMCRSWFLNTTPEGGLRARGMAGSRSGVGRPLRKLGSTTDFGHVTGLKSNQPERGTSAHPFRQGLKGIETHQIWSKCEFTMVLKASQPH